MVNKCFRSSPSSACLSHFFVSANTWAIAFPYHVLVRSCEEIVGVTDRSWESEELGQGDEGSLLLYIVYWSGKNDRKRSREGDCEEQRREEVACQQAHWLSRKHRGTGNSIWPQVIDNTWIWLVQEDVCACGLYSTGAQSLWMLNSTSVHIEREDLVQYSSSNKVSRAGSVMNCPTGIIVHAEEG